MSVRIITGDALTELAKLPAESVHCCVTSPPYYGLRDYGVEGQLGLEPTPDAYVAAMVGVFREVRRVLRLDGTLWLNIGDSYASDTKWGGKTSGKHVRALAGDTGIGRRRQNTGLKSKDLIGIPWMLAFALRADGWWLRQDIIWAKPNPMPESVTDRCTKAHEYLFLLSKSERYHYDAAALREPVADATAARYAQATPMTISGQFKGSPTDKRFQDEGKKIAGSDLPTTANKRSVWTIATAPFPEAHFATFPPALVEPCILAGCPVGGTVLDPFGGAGTTGLVADRLGRNATLIELNPAYAGMAKRRIEADAGLFANVAN